MSETTARDPDPSATPDDASLDALHERVNEMLEVPLPKEGDAFPLPVEETLGATPPASA